MKKPEIYSEKRPWGKFTQYALNKKCTVKILAVLPNQELSLQSHEHREELWVALDNELKAQLDEKIIPLKKGQEILIPKGTKHRLIGGKKTGEVLEISFGFFDEKDEKRFEDKYGRN
jgi:mannose-6-phosphate isomerase